MRLVFIGPPGAGKGTQCQRLAAHFEIMHLSTGQMLRHAKASQSPLGKIVGPILDSGSLVDDDTMNKIVRERISADDCSKGFILDGYPRTIPQANSLTQFLKSNNRLSAAILLHVDRDELVRRLNQRFQELENPRPEDQPKAIPKRLDIYEEVTRPLVEYYESNLCRIDGSGTPDQVFGRIQCALLELGNCD
jgi:adenylate kinase